MEKQTLGEKTAEKLLDMIHERGYTAGDKLPTEMELCQLLGAGRNTVREALRILVSRNIVTIRQGAGTFISEKNGIPDDPLGFAMMEDRRKLTRDLLQIRVMLEPPIAALAAQNADEEDIKKLEEIPAHWVEAREKATTRGDEIAAHLERLKLEAAEDVSCTFRAIWGAKA